MWTTGRRRPGRPGSTRRRGAWLISFEVKQRSLHQSSGHFGSNSEDFVSRFENGPLELVLGDVQD